MTDMYLKISLNSDPTVAVWVRTSEANQATKRRSIQGDIAYQKFPRWAPFAGLQYSTDYTIRAYQIDKTTPYFN
jgi:hypothetical protein